MVNSEPSSQASKLDYRPLLFVVCCLFIRVHSVQSQLFSTPTGYLHSNVRTRHEVVAHLTQYNECFSLLGYYTA